MRFGESPEAPEGVEIYYRDGTRQKVEVAYLGWYPIESLHIWEVTSQVEVENVARITISMMPPQSAVTMSKQVG